MGGMKTLTADDFLSIQSPAPLPVDLPGDCGRVFVRVMTGSERDGFEQWFMDAKNKRAGLVGFRARLVALTLCDENGDRLFTDSPEHLQQLGAKPAPILQRIFEAAQKHNAMTEEEIDEIAGN